MKKRISAFLLMLVLFVTAALPVCAADNALRLADNADLLTSGEETELLSLLDEISNRQQVDIAVVTTDTLDGKAIGVYADDYYDANGYRADGVLLVVDMSDRDWYITTSGFGITAVTDAGREYMSERFVNDLGAGNYAAAFTSYAELCDDFITQAKTGAPYDAGNLPKEPFAVLRNLLIALAVGFIVALIITGVMKGKLKSVRSQSAAGSYIKNGSMRVTHNSELFLYTRIERREREKKEDAEGSKTHTSSSGTTHGGGGGSF